MHKALPSNDPSVRNKLMFRVKYDLLSKDRQYVMQLEGETFRDLDALDADIKFITTHDHTRKDEHDQLLAMAKYEETAKWAKCFENVKMLFELAKVESVLWLAPLNDTILYKNN